MPTAATPPLILTLTLDPNSQAYFNELRQRHFPPAINHLAAHVTLFHHLPGTELEAVCDELRRRALPQAVLPLRVTGLRFLGMGVAFSLENLALRTLHHELQTGWHPQLTAQDRHKFNPHVTVQNKVPPDEARRLFLELSRGFQSFEAQGTGLHLWAYRGGPWESLRQFPFAAEGRV